jgi:hypothetical protein
MFFKLVNLILANVHVRYFHFGNTVLGLNFHKKVLMPTQEVLP